MLKQSYTYALLSLSLLISTGAYASLLKIKESSVHAPGKLGKVELFHDDYPDEVFWPSVYRWYGFFPQFVAGFCLWTCC